MAPIEIEDDERLLASILSARDIIFESVCSCDVQNILSHRQAEKGT